MGVPRKAYVYLAKGIRSAVSKPVISSNRINDPKEGEEILRSGGADLVTMARGLLADPELPTRPKQGNPGWFTIAWPATRAVLTQFFKGVPPPAR